MIEISAEMREAIDNALANGTPCILATASRAGEPSIGFRGSMMVWDQENLAYWERSKKSGIEHIEENPLVVVLYRDPARRLGWKFFGTATVFRDGPLREQVMGRVVPRELEPDPERKGYAVIIRVDRITTLGEKDLQLREPSPTAAPEA